MIRSGLDRTKCTFRRIVYIYKGPQKNNEMFENSLPAFGSFWILDFFINRISRFVKALPAAQVRLLREKSPNLPLLGEGGGICLFSPAISEVIIQRTELSLLSAKIYPLRIRIFVSTIKHLSCRTGFAGISPDTKSMSIEV